MVLLKLSITETSQRVQLFPRERNMQGRKHAGDVH